MNRAAMIIALVGGMLCSCKAKNAQTTGNLISRCMEAQHTTDDYVLVTKCAPLGPQERFEGTWLVAFELNAFRKDYSSVPVELAPDAYELVATPAVNSRVRVNPAIASAYQITFLGREVRVPVGIYKTIVLDRVMSLNPVPVSPDIYGPQPQSSKHS